MSETLMRQWQMLRLIPRKPSKMATTEIKQRLEEEGFKITQRTIQRDLVTFSSIFPLVCDDRDKPYGWSWESCADVMDIPGMDSHTALAFYLAKEHLQPILPIGTVNHLKPHFAAAKIVLDKVDKGSGAPAWKNKVRVLHRGANLISPNVKSEVQDAIYDALLMNRQVRISYCSRSQSASKEYIINPLGLVLKEGIFYLVCTFDGYDDYRLLTLHRMLAAEKLDIPSVQPAQFSLDDYIVSGELNFGVWGYIDLKAKVSAHVAFHLKECQLDKKQQLSELDDGRFLLQAHVLDTSELRWWLTGFGAQVEVLEPRALRDEFHKVAKELLEQYEYGETI
ncbi:MAG: WYL domain-containing protein [Mariprofundaceae bacterium]|nr:WYL domain-containing protein [Mariprofundaceae bacterium]